MASTKFTNSNKLAFWALGIGLFLLLTSVLWLFAEVGRLDFSFLDFPLLSDQVAENTSDIHSLSTAVDANASVIRTLASGIDNNAANIRTLASDLAYTTALAENANRYAHSHYSDVRLKENIAVLDDVLPKLIQLDAVTYNWNREAPTILGYTDPERQIGLIAQDVEQVFPELVSEDHNGYKRIDYEKLTPILLAAIKEQQVQIDELRIRLSEIQQQHLSQ